MVPRRVRLPPTTQGHKDKVRSVCFSPDGKYLASGSVDKTVRISAVADGSLVRELKVCAGDNACWVVAPTLNPLP